MDLTSWILLLQDYNLTLKYIKGEKNTVADYLSRNTAVAPTCGSCNKTIRLFQVSLTTFLLNSPAKTLKYVEASDQDPLIQDVFVGTWGRMMRALYKKLGELARRTPDLVTISVSCAPSGPIHNITPSSKIVPGKSRNIRITDPIILLRGESSKDFCTLECRLCGIFTH